VTEGEREDEDLAPFAEGLAVTDREGIVDTCRALLADPGRRAALGGSALSVMLDRRQSALLADLIGLDGDGREARR